VHWASLWGRPQCWHAKGACATPNKKERSGVFMVHCVKLIRDRIIGNNHVAISYWAISRYHNMATIWQRCLHSIKWWLYGCRTCTVYVTILQLYNHCLTTGVLNINTCSTRWTARLTQMQHKTLWLLACLNSFAQAAVIENTWLYLLCLPLQLVSCYLHGHWRRDTERRKRGGRVMSDDCSD